MEAKRRGRPPGVPNKPKVDEDGVVKIRRRRKDSAGFEAEMPLVAPLEEERQVKANDKDTEQYDKQIKRFVLSKFVDKDIVETSELLRQLPSDARREWAKALHEACLMKTIQEGGSLDAITRAVKVVVDNLTEQKESEGAAFEEALKLVEEREKANKTILGPIE
jgi:hypothetical protein